MAARIAHLRASETLVRGRYRKLAARRATTGTQLRGVDLSDSTVERSDLRKADLRGTTQREMCFTRVELRESDLRGADLRDATFTETDLTGANFTGATLDSAIFSDDTICTNGRPHSEEPCIP